jgi:hypothetical protein
LPRQRGQRRCAVCGGFFEEWSRTSASSTFQAVSRDVACARKCPLVPKRTRFVPARRRYLAAASNTTCPFAGLLSKPSDGLEPSTPPYHFGVVATGGNPRQRISLIFAVFADSPFAADCHWLRLLGSTNAPSLVVGLGSSGTYVVDGRSSSREAGASSAAPATTACRP